MDVRVMTSDVWSFRVPT